MDTESISSGYNNYTYRINKCREILKKIYEKNDRNLAGINSIVLDNIISKLKALIRIENSLKLEFHTNIEMNSRLGYITRSLENTLLQAFHVYKEYQSFLIYKDYDFIREVIKNENKIVTKEMISDIIEEMNETIDPIIKEIYKDGVSNMERFFDIIWCALKIDDENTTDESLYKTIKSDFKDMKESFKDRMKQRRIRNSKMCSANKIVEKFIFITTKYKFIYRIYYSYNINKLIVKNKEKIIEKKIKILL